MKTVLLIEDDELLKSGVQEMLEVEGFHVVGAEDGMEALSWMSEIKVDLVITDLMMPGMNGAELIVRLTKTHPRLPVIVVSGAIDVIDKLMGHESFNVLGVQASLMKPFKLTELIDKAKELIALAESTQGQAG